MNFFQAQKKIAYLWFIWGFLLISYIGIGIIYNNYDDVLKELIDWLLKYLASILTLITGSNFFKKDIFDELLRDKIYFRLAYIGSILYLIYITEIIVVEPMRKGDMDNKDYIQILDQSGFFLKFFLTILITLLSFFFYDNRKSDKISNE
jgi:hypothetical protein